MDGDSLIDGLDLDGTAALSTVWDPLNGVTLVSFAEPSTEGWR